MPRDANYGFPAYIAMSRRDDTGAMRQHRFFRWAEVPPGAASGLVVLTLALRVLLCLGAGFVALGVPANGLRFVLDLGWSWPVFFLIGAPLALWWALRPLAFAIRFVTKSEAEANEERLQEMVRGVVDKAMSKVNVTLG